MLCACLDELGLEPIEGAEIAIDRWCQRAGEPGPGSAGLGAVKGGLTDFSATQAEMGHGPRDGISLQPLGDAKNKKRGAYFRRPDLS